MSTRGAGIRYVRFHQTHLEVRFQQFIVCVKHTFLAFGHRPTEVFGLGGMHARHFVCSPPPLSFARGPQVLPAVH